MWLLLTMMVFGGDICDLGSDSYRVREQAQVRLERWSAFSWRVCSLYADSPDRERAFRCRRVVERALSPVAGAGEEVPALCAVWIKEHQLELYRGMYQEWVWLPEGWQWLWGKGDDGFANWYRMEGMRWRTRATCRVLVQLGVPVKMVRAAVRGLRACETQWPKRRFCYRESYGW